MMNQQAASTVAARTMRPKTMAPGRFNAQKFQNPGAGSNRARTVNRSRFQNPGAGGGRPPQSRGPSQMGGGWYTATPGGQVPGQYQTPGRPNVGGGRPQGGFPGDTSWWRQGAQNPPQRMWGSPQFNFMGGNAPSAQQGGGPNWGGGGTPSWMGGGGQQGGGSVFGGGGQRGGYGQMSGYGGGGMGSQFAGYGGGGGGMPQGGMPGYQGQQFQNQAYGALQDRIYNQMIMSEMPWGAREKARFEQGAAGSGYDIGQNSGQGQIFEGYGDTWGYNPSGWESSGGNYTPFQRKYNMPQWGGGGGGGYPSGGGFGGGNPFGSGNPSGGGFGGGGNPFGGGNSWWNRR